MDGRPPCWQVHRARPSAVETPGKSARDPTARLPRLDATQGAPGRGHHGEERPAAVGSTVESVVETEEPARPKAHEVAGDRQAWPVQVVEDSKAAKEVDAVISDGEVSYIPAGEDRIRYIREVLPSDEDSIRKVDQGNGVDVPRELGAPAARSAPEVDDE